MNNKWKWALGIGVVIIILLVLSLAWGFLLPYGGYGMMGYGYGWHMPMMYGGFGMMGFGMFFMWAISLVSLILIGLGIAGLVKTLTAPK